MGGPCLITFVHKWTYVYLISVTKNKDSHDQSYDWGVDVQTMEHVVKECPMRSCRERCTKE